MYKALYTNYSQNPDLVNQVSHLKFNNPIYLVKDKEGDASERDKSSNFLIFLSNENKVIASARIQILEAEKEGSLNYDSKFTYDMFKDFFIPGLEVNNFKRAQVSHLLVNEALPKDLRKRIFKDLANNAYKICAEEDCDLIITLAMKSKKNASKILFEAMCDNFPTFDLSEKFGTHKIISDHSYNESHLDRKIFVGARNKELENLLAYNFGQTKHIPIKFTPSAITINLDKEPPKTILLDVHGIFYDMEDIWSECLSYGLSKLHEQGVEYDHNFKFKHKPDIYKDINELFKDSSENAKKLVSMVREHYINMSQKELAINKDALELIHYLKHNKIDFLLVSNAPEKVISRDVYVIKHKYKKLFNKSIDIKYIADAGKPSIDKTIVAIGNKLSSDPTKHDFLLVGDKLNDLDFARNLGITGVLIGRKELQDSMRDGRTDFLFFEEIGDLKTYLSRIISTQKTSSTTPFKH